ncbi:MAG: hypothetical protein Tsb0034_02890 [Ekhidna sp.]
MLKRVIQIPILSFLCIHVLSAQETEFPAKKSYTTAWAESEIIIDGKLDDSAWEQVEWGGEFVGNIPEYNVKPTQETQFKILYDAKFLYVGIRAFDDEPDKIVKRMSRRDGFDGDFVEINIDSYNDKRTAFSFTASVSGVKGDEYVSNNGENWDATWDPIWYLRTSIDEKGWIAEFKIPLSQLRFANKETHIWGIQFTRRYFRNEERSTWQPIDPNAPGWVHLFGELNGLAGIKPQKQLEIQPYVLASAQKYPKEEDNPFRSSGKELTGNIGLDAKVGITSDITLDLTLNPDFGQVDADPSVVNLTAFQQFFQERRPFFLEGNNLLTFPTSGGVNNLYYSRRIGARPSGSPDNVDYIDKPNQTRIISAAKVTGKNSKGFSWGIQEALTNRERAEVQYEDGTMGEEVVEPYTNFLVGRAQQDIQGGKTVVGTMFTHTNRFDNRTNELDLLHDNAFSGGVDLDHNFKDRKYGMILRFMFSKVNGTRGAIYESQTASERFFQRPNNFHKGLDSTRTSLTGTAGTFAFGKRSGNWQWTIGSNYRSPELELNDIGFLVQTDNINNWFFSRYRVNRIVGPFRSQSYNFYAEQNMDFGKVTTNKGFNFNLNWQFQNYWEYGQGFWLGGQSVSNADLRGGPSITYPGNFNYWYWFGTNPQKKVRMSFNNWFNWGFEGFRKSSGINVNVTLRPADALNISVAPNVSWSRDNLQYIDQKDFQSDIDYILGSVARATYSMSIRANYNITPNLTLEFWGQPFIASGQFSEFKTVHEPNAESYTNRFKLFEENQVRFDEEEDEFQVFKTGDEEPDYTFDNPNFNVVQFRSNFVMRWEYIPGSTLFLVWSNSGSYSDSTNGNSFNDLTSELLNLSATNTFLIKYTYRFIL